MLFLAQQRDWRASSAPCGSQCPHVSGSVDQTTANSMGRAAVSVGVDLGQGGIYRFARRMALRAVFFREIVCAFATDAARRQDAEKPVKNGLSAGSLVSLL